MEYYLTDHSSYAMQPIQIKQEAIVSDAPENSIDIYEGWPLKLELNACEGFDDTPKPNDFTENVVNNVDTCRSTSIKQEVNDENHLTSDFCNSLDQCVINTLDNEEAVYERITNENCKLNQIITFPLGNQNDCIDDKSILKPLMTVIESDKLHETHGKSPEKYNVDKSEVIRNKFKKRKFIEIIQSDTRDLGVSPKRKKTNEPKILVDNNKKSQKSQKQTNLLNYTTKVKNSSELIKTKKNRVRTTVDLTKLSHVKIILEKINVNDYIANKNIEILKNNEKQNNIKNIESAKLSLIKNQNQNIKLSKCFNRCCIKCDNIYTSEEYRIRKNCPKCKTPFLFECEKCKRKYKYYISLYAHIKYKCYPKSIFKCDHCGFETSKKDSLSTHIKRKHLTIHPKDYNICSKCGKGFKTLSSLHQHETYCKTDLRFKCSICSYDTKLKRDFAKHMHYHYINKNEKDIVDNSSNGNFISNNSAQRKSLSADIKRCMIDYCSNCEKGTESKEGLKCRNCRSLLSFRCTICSADSIARAKLYQHVKLSHFPYELEQCPKCKKYVKPEYFLLHRRRCEEEPHIQCSYCSYKTKEKRNLTKHVQNQHVKSDPIQCGKCGKFYKNVYTIQRHKLHCNKEPHLKCDHCAFKTAKKDSIRRHMSMTHVELFTDRKLQCEFCKIKISNLYLLEQHIAKCACKGA